MQVPNQCNAQCIKNAKTKYFCIFNIDAMKMQNKKTLQTPRPRRKQQAIQQDTETENSNALIINQEGDKTRITLKEIQ